MSALLSWFQFPILTRELTEQAARRRTYALRAGLAVLLWFIVLLINAENLNAARDGAGGTGSGARMLGSLQATIYLGLALIVPAIASDVFTAEKERGTLGLLLLTRLTGGQLVIQKYASRMTLILSIVLPAIPLLALAYSLGGVSESVVIFTAAGWVMFAAQLAALSVFSSTISRSTLGATILTYLLLAALYVLPLVVSEMFGLRGLDLEDGLFGVPVRLAVELNFVDSGLVFHVAALWNVVTFASQLMDAGTYGNYSAAYAAGLAVYRSLPLWAGVAFLLVLSRVFLWRCAFLPAKNWLAIVQRSLDRFFKRINENRVTRGKVLFEERGQELALYQPIAWLETQKRGLGRIQHLIRFTILLELPILLSFVFYLITAADWDMRILGSFSLCIVWIVTAVYLATRGASLVNGDRSRETLDALLTTPLTDREIVLEKLRGARRVLIALWIPILSQLLLNALLMSTGSRFYASYGGGYDLFGNLRGVVYFVTHASLYFTTTWCWMWACCWAGLVIRGVARATVTLIVVYLLWAGALYAVEVLPVVFDFRPRSADAFIYVQGPLLTLLGAGAAFLALPRRFAGRPLQRGVTVVGSGLLLATYLYFALPIAFDLTDAKRLLLQGRHAEPALYWVGSPLGAMIHAEIPFYPWPIMLVWVPPIAMLGWGLRTRCLTEFSKCVGRIDADR